MTFSILARDSQSGALGGAAATGSLCVGGWVLRGRAGVGMSAAQGAAPSTIWGETVLEAMAGTQSAEAAVADVVAGDRGRDWRQLTAIDARGGTGAFTGKQNTPWRGAIAQSDVAVAGNLLAGPDVLSAVLEAFHTTRGAFAERLLAALEAGEAAGGDARGLQSAALLVVATGSAPLTLRVDWAPDPVGALRQLHDKTQEVHYAEWYRTVPTLDHPERGGDG